MMKEIFRKPRIFLSHSKKDIDFIRRLDGDLRSCQCETWIDEADIQHGKPWLDEIFTNGIPSCEIVLCYVTPRSIESNMVRQEIDARLIERMQDARVTILPYASSEEVRNQLRSDLRALQIPILNEKNYFEMLPRVIAAVWRAHLDWATHQAVQSEKVRRLELELEVRTLKDQRTEGIFSNSEDADFSAIWSWMDNEIRLNVKIYIDKTKEVLRTVVCAMNIKHIYRECIGRQKFSLSMSPIQGLINATVAASCDVNPKETNVQYKMPVEFEAEFLKFGFLQRISRPPSPDSPLPRMLGTRYDLMFTEKFDRFNYWIMRTQNAQDAPDKNYFRHRLENRLISFLIRRMVAAIVK